MEIIFPAEFNENSKESRFNAYLHDLFISGTTLVEEKLGTL